MNTIAHIPENAQKRLVIVGGGFAGLKLASSLANTDIQVVLIDKYNYHQFQPLYYQVATAGLEPSAISFPFRKTFHHKKNIHFRLAEMKQVEPANNRVLTDIGWLDYDYLAVCVGADTNYFGMENIINHALPMKSTSEALGLRNTILMNFEKALNTTDSQEMQALLNIVIVGGGPTGVELAGALAEMKKYILPKDYPELDFNLMKVYLVESSPTLLGPMSENAQKKSLLYLQRLGVEVVLDDRVVDYDGYTVQLQKGKPINSKLLIWAAGVKGVKIEGISAEAIGRAGRILVDKYNAVKGYDNIYALGDIALMADEKLPNGHPQLAPVAIQQAKNLAKNLLNKQKNKPLVAFNYKDRGSMATVGRNMAVTDLPRFKFSGFFAWVVWLFVHLMSIIGVKNKLFIFLNWAWTYFTFDQSLRLLIRAKMKERK